MPRVGRRVVLDLDHDLGLRMRLPRRLHSRAPAAAPAAVAAAVAAAGGGAVCRQLVLETPLRGPPHEGGQGGEEAGGA